MGRARKSSVGIVAILHNARIGSEAHLASCSMDKGTCSLGVKWPGPGANNANPSSREVTNAWSYASTSPHKS